MRKITLALSALALIAGVAAANANSGAPHIGGSQEGYNYRSPFPTYYGDSSRDRGMYEGRAARVQGQDGTVETYRPYDPSMGH